MVSCSKQSLAGEAEPFEQADRGGVLDIDLGDELAGAGGQQVVDQRGGAFARDALALPVDAADVADLQHALLVSWHGDEAASHPALAILRDQVRPGQSGAASQPHSSSAEAKAGRER